ncbi:hypothetical protein ACOME3_009438 [Neoechinorhynchus agilis]
MSLVDELICDLDDIVEATPNRAVGDEVNDKKGSICTPTEIGVLLSSDRFAKLFNRIRERALHSLPQWHEVNRVEADSEYSLFVDANEMIVELEREIEMVYRHIRSVYRIRFPELESLIPVPMDYVKTVKVYTIVVCFICVARNGSSSHKLVVQRTNGEIRELSDFLNPATIMIVTITASTTQGVALNETQLESINEACSMALKLAEYVDEFGRFVETRMSWIAPNLSALVGAPVASKLIGCAGGLHNLSRMPACNILLLGTNRKFISSCNTDRFALSKQEVISNIASLSTSGTIGHLNKCDLIETCPTHEIRVKIARLTACKCALAARVDSFRGCPSGKNGQNFRSEVLKKIEKLVEPPPTKTVKPLAPPIDQPGNRRGGRRARKMKERLGITEIRKQANRMNFGQIEQDAYQEDLELSMGQLGVALTDSATGNSSSGVSKVVLAGRVRAAPIDAKIKTRISQKLHRSLQRERRAVKNSFTPIGGNRSSISKRSVCGTASSVVFTPFQGLEIISAGAMSEVTGCDGEIDGKSVSSVMSKTTLRSAKRTDPLPGRFAEAQKQSGNATPKYFSNTSAFSKAGRKV